MISRQEISRVHRREEMSNPKIQNLGPGVLSLCIAQNQGSAGASEIGG